MRSRAARFSLFLSLFLLALLAHSLSGDGPTFAPHLYGIHDHAPFPGPYLDVMEAAGGGWVTATIAVGANPNNMNGESFTAFTDRGHTVIGRLNYGYFPDGTVPGPSKWDDFAQRCANFVANSTGCHIWTIGNETNLAAEWPLEDGKFSYISPEDYAVLFRKVYDAIKAVRPNDHVLPQPLAPWAGPYGSGEFWVNGEHYPHDGMPINWVQYKHRMLSAIEASGPLDGIAVHINSRGYSYDDIHSPQRVNAGGQSLSFSFYVYKDWIEFGIPESLYHLPLYATESNGNYFWKGGHPEAPDETYQAGWMQEIYAEINRHNQQAALSGQPIFRCINMYRWCAGCDGWNIDGDSNPFRQLILDDLLDAVNQAYTWPEPSEPQEPPETPDNLSATAGDGRVDLEWSPSLGARSYRIERSTTAEGPFSLMADGVRATTYVNTSFVPGTAYYYRVIAINDRGESSPSNLASATPVNGLPDMVVTAVDWSPRPFFFGDSLVFRATVKNKGSAPTPSGIILGVGFVIDGQGTVSWSGSHTSSVAPGASLTLVADGGPSGNTWPSSIGRQILTATVNDVNRFPEGNHANNSMKAPVHVQHQRWTTNSGGDSAESFAADHSFSGGNTYTVTDNIVTTGVTNPAPQDVYRSERWGTFTYTLSDLSPRSEYTVRLHFAEIFFDSPGQRIFHVRIQGEQVLTNFDILAEAGGEFRALVKEFPAEADPTGKVVVEFLPVADNPKSSGIEALFLAPHRLGAAPLIQVTPIYSGLRSIITWPASAGRRYRLQYTNDLSTSGWLTLGPAIAADGPWESREDEAPTRRRFYRIEQVD